jgi:hypothetical protein
MRPRQALSAALCTAAFASAWVVPCSSAAGLGLYTERSSGTPEQIAWVRRAAGNFLSAELAGNGAGACAILNAPLRTSSHHRTCAQRWDARLAAMLRRSGTRAQLRHERDAVPTASVVVRGDTATITLPQPLLNGRNRFLWTENCWMLAG